MIKPETKRTRAVEKEESKIKSQLDRNNMTKKVFAYVSSFSQRMHDLSEEFNRIRVQLIDLNGSIKGHDEEALRYVMMAKSIAQGDYGELLGEVPPIKGTSYVQDSAMFTKFVDDLSGEKRYDVRIKMCMRAKRALVTSIQDYQSKISKMGALSSTAGSTDNEVLVANKRIVQFNEAVKTLIKRIGTIDDIYEATTRALRAYVKKSDAVFYSLTV